MPSTLDLAALAESAVAEIQAKIPAGVGITLNALYINQRQFGFQFPQWQELKREGLPIEGFCVAAGIPSTEKAAEIIEGLRAAGIKHVAFKPGSVDGIRQVVTIAAANPDFPIICQWTGGRAGGHHSYEDFHQPILATYGSIRQQSNISLIAGSGFGGSEDVWPYINGDWSLAYGVQRMPFDGVLYASRVMVAKEAHTSLSVKKLICAAPGVDDSKWEGTYAKETGGILTVRSELGEPIHKVATRGVKLWKEFDNTVFNMPKEKRVAWLTQNRDSVIEKLNKDFSKPWFGWKKNGAVVPDIGDMTYEEVALRMIRLMYVSHENRWVDISLRNLTGDWLRRVEERFAGVDGTKSKASILQSFTSLDSPADVVKSFFETYPAATEQLVAHEDKAYFLAIAQRPGQKPVPFIPVLDASFEVWFKKLKHVGMNNGKKAIVIETINQRGEKVIMGTAEVAQAPTVYVFTGQGSQEPGMGMELYNSSPAARAVWEAADEHLLAVYGFSIVDIVKNNPKTKTIHFGGMKGQAIRQRYMAMTYDTSDKDGTVKTLPLFADIDVRTPRYTFSHPNGLLFATQFAQIALVVTEKAAFEDMRSKGLVPPRCAFAGHSLGEYSALASIADTMPIASLVDVVFYRGITMQRAVERDSQNRSNYAIKDRHRQVSREYAQRIYDQTSSPRLDKVLKAWEEEAWDSPAQRQQLTYIILVELLAYQFASPVRWIETQDLLFTHFKFERLVEIGPSPTLTGMATRTLKAKYEAQDGSISLVRSIFCSAKHTKEIYYQFEDEPEAAPAEATTSTPGETPSAAPVPVAAPVAVAVAPPVGGAASIPDEPIKAIDTLRVIIAQKLKKRVDEVPLSKSIKDLVGGKSTLQNEILGDLQAEFASAPEKGEELPLEELGSALGVGYSGSLGKYTTGMISRMVGAKMPGGFNLSAIKSHLSKTWGLGAARSDGALLLAVTMEPAKRLGSEGEAKAWLDSVVSAYAQQTGISLSSGASSGGAGGASGGAVMNSEEFLKFQAQQHEFARQQVELYMRYLDQDSRIGHRLHAEEKASSLVLQSRLDDISKEHGDTYIQGIQPVFEPLKARHFDSSWNWARQDALLMYYDIIFGRLTTVDRDITSRCITLMNRADPALIRYMQYHMDTCSPERGETYKLAKDFGLQLLENCKEALGKPPVYKDVTFPTAPYTEVTAQGDIVSTEVVRKDVRKLEAYVEEMAKGDAVPTVNIQKVQDDVVRLWNVVKSQPEITEDQKNRIKGLYDSVVRSLHKSPSDVRTPPRIPAPRSRRSSSQFLRPQVTNVASVTPDRIPLLHLKRKVGTNWEYSSNLTGVYLDILNEIATSGTTFEGKNALLTGCGKASIGVEILKGLLSGGAHSASSLSDLAKLQGLIDLEKVIVVTGYAEVGPWGSSRTRWEMEARGQFTIQGCIEMAWLMGYIKHFNGRLKTGELYVGWTDAKSGEPVDDKDVRAKYEKEILVHAGIRLIEPELFKGYDPKKKTFQQEIELNHDLEPLEVSSAEAAKFKLLHGDKCDAWELESGEWMVKFKKGARVLVPKAVQFDRLVAGQIPTGWDAGRYGIPADIVAQTDRTALWALVCTAEALIMSGVTDPYELYKYVHPSEVGSSLGSGMGGMQSLAAMFIERREEKEVQKDILQETFINTVAGWVNLLLLSSSGPIKIPVGACATALQSVEIACDTILSGKAKVMIAGGFDDFSEEGSFEFANMKATSNAETEFAMGREPNEFSRPTTSTRAGFMESQGTGVQVLMSAKTALEMGAAIRGIVAFTSTSTDKAGRSIPAPGRGVLTIGRETAPASALPTLEIDYRVRQLKFRRKQIAQWMENEQELLKEELELRAKAGEPTEEYIRERTVTIEQEAARQEKDALATFGMLEGADPRIAPLRRALAVWGLTADDIGVISIHGTSTKANDKNESNVYNDVFKNLSRTPGNAVPVVAQKNLTGHPKGGAAAWMFIGLTQCINTGIIPGNRNADNVDSDLRQYEYLVYPSKTIHTDGIRAGLMRTLLRLPSASAKLVAAHSSFTPASSSVPWTQLRMPSIAL
ncbi:hypothetical protein M407DRAFT_12583 [Tulasnella calospora MUT 4182]|uniref:Uncharacterized protein n=1 Tax=Tulasnella calospora MUT 4182 TaxID=1051891 RepID=A0A0C3PQR2_9AGAM|nr:hypothetical protein M407DRAFT_12583 [Tulasnella calospora MUT 4182]